MHTIKQMLLKSSALLRIAKPLIRFVALSNGAVKQLARLQYHQVVVDGSLVVKPLNIEGEFELNATSDLALRIVLDGTYEPEVTRALKKISLEGGSIVNIGANVGLFSVFLARNFPQCVRVIAIEPNPAAFRLLELNIVRNRFVPRIHAIPVCIGEEKGSVTLSTIPGKPEYSSVNSVIHPSVSSYNRESVSVEMRTLDEVVGAEAISMMFIDTEGAEAMVLAGAEAVLKRDKPIVYFEYSSKLLEKFGASSKDLEMQLNRLGYVVRDGRSYERKIQHPFEGDGIAIHQDRLRQLPGR